MNQTTSNSTKPTDSNVEKSRFGRTQDIPYLRESSAHLFQGFLHPKNRVRIRINGALDAHARSETTISLSVASL